MAIIDLVRWAPQESETIYAWRFPHTNLSTYTQLVVAESQEAILFSKGQIVGKFGPGKHTLSTENIPILRSLFGLPFGGNNPFTAEVWFVNKVQRYNIPWETNRIPIHDVDYNVHLPLKAQGLYGLHLVDAEKFLMKLVGTRHIFTERDMNEQFEGEFLSKLPPIIMRYMMQHRVGYKQITAYLTLLSEHAEGLLSSFWAELGVQLSKFYVTAIEIDDSTPDGRKIKDAISQQSAMAITGHTWQQEQMFSTMNNAIDGMGNSQGMGLLGGLMAMNMMSGGTSGVGAAAMQTQYGQPSFSSGHIHPQGGAIPSVASVASTPQQVFCSNCAKRFSSSSAFCPHCGDAYNPCPKCGTDNDPKSKRCISCGTSLNTEVGQPSIASACHSCGSTLLPGAKFCAACGTPCLQGQVVGRSCVRCAISLGSEKFCPNCGAKNA